MTSHGTKAPNCSKICKRIISYMSNGIEVSRTGCEDIHFEHTHRMRSNWLIPDLVDS